MLLDVLVHEIQTYRHERLSSYIVISPPHLLSSRSVSSTSLTYSAMRTCPSLFGCLYARSPSAKHAYTNPNSEKRGVRTQEYSRNNDSDRQTSPLSSKTYLSNPQCTHPRSHTRTPRTLGRHPTPRPRSAQTLQTRPSAPAPSASRQCPRPGRSSWSRARGRRAWRRSSRPSRRPRGCASRGRRPR